MQLVKLKAKKLLPYLVNEEQKKSSLGLLFQSKVSLADLEFLTVELSLLLATGVRIDRGLDIIRRTKAKASLAQMLANISSIKKGVVFPKRSELTPMSLIIYIVT